MANTTNISPSLLGDTTNNDTQEEGIAQQVDVEMKTTAELDIDTGDGTGDNTGNGTGNGTGDDTVVPVIPPIIPFNTLTTVTNAGALVNASRNSDV